MFHDLDASIGSLLGDVLNTPKRVVFDRPGRAGWNDSPKQPTLLCTLSHFAEDLARRNAEWTDVRGADGLVTGRMPPVRWVTVTYTVTAWAADAATEHRMLGEVFGAFVLDATLGVDHRLGEIADLDELLTLECRPAAVDRTAVTTNESGQLTGRAALELSVVVPVKAAVDTDVAPPAREIELGLDKRNPERPADGDAGDSADVAAAPLDPTQKKWTTFRVRETSS